MQRAETPLVWSKLSEQQRAACLERPAQESTLRVRADVEAIIAAVRSGGDEALGELSLRFDGVCPAPLEVPPAQTDEALANLSPPVRAALELAAANIAAFHRPQIPATIKVETAPGIACERRWFALDRVGLYVPGGSAPLVSTVLMLAIPARLAGVSETALCTPPRSDGSVHPAILAAARLVGVDRIFAVGGAQAIAAMAFGTTSIAAVDKICGPGNSWVTEAKRLCALHPQGADLDLPAGPSEVMVIADDSAPPDFIAADLLAQAEHGPDSQVILVTTSTHLVAAVDAALQRQLASLSRREIASAALAHARFIVAGDLQQAMAISNRYAPEHLILMVANARDLCDQVRAAGSVFVGSLSPESAGDYASGTNHVLPTEGWARRRGGLCVEDFMRAVTLQELSAQGVYGLAGAVETLAELEGLDAHALAMKLRRLAQSAGGMP